MELNTPITVIFFGIQGAGKGTQARLLRKYLDENTRRKTLYLETGQLLRNFAEKDGYTNKLVDDVISHGELLPSFMPTYVLGKELANSFTGEEHLIFDGAARRKDQATMIDSILRLYKRTPYHVIILDIPEELAIERMLGRGREDDTKESIQKRIAWTKEHEAEILEKFEHFNCTIHTIDGSKPIADIQKDIYNALNI